MTVQLLHSSSAPRRVTRTLACATVILAATAAATGVPAQEVRLGPEIGVRGGITRYFDKGLSDGITVTALPVAGYPFVTSAYLTYFTSSRTAIEPQAGLLRYSDEGEGTTYITLGAQLMQFAKPSAAGTNAGYGFIHGGMVGASGDNASSTTFHAGAGAGYRWVYRKSLGLRVEARYRRHFDSSLWGVNELSLGLGFGAILGANEQ